MLKTVLTLLIVAPSSLYGQEFRPNLGPNLSSRLLESPDLAGNVSMIWNVSGSYRKYYLKCFQDRTIPANFNGTWKMVTAFGSAPVKEWEATAIKLAKSLQKK